MKIVRYQARTASASRYGILEGDVIVEADGTPFDTFEKSTRRIPLADVKLLAPCEPSKVVAGGANYYGHVREVGLAIPETPVFFLKPPTTVIGHEESIVYPPQSQRLDYEGELAVVVKHKMRNVEPNDVRRHVLGYTCVNDVTARDIQNWGGNLLHLCHSKSFDTFCPTGPVIETDIDPNALDLKLTVNGVMRQSTNTSDMIFTVERMVSYFSQVMTLMPGDLVLTGTPAGIGSMDVGDIVELTIAGIGTLRNTVVRPL